jgi:hypothetical protein
VDFHDVNRTAPHTVLGVPLLGVAGEARAPEPGEVLVPSRVADYVGVHPGAKAIVELIYTGSEKPVVRRFESRLIGTFDAVGPDQGRFDPFWRFNWRGHDVLTVRPPTASGGTTLPIVVNERVLREFLSFVWAELDKVDARSSRQRSGQAAFFLSRCWWGFLGSALRARRSRS